LRHSGTPRTIGPSPIGGTALILRCRTLKEMVLTVVST